MAHRHNIAAWTDDCSPSAWGASSVAVGLLADGLCTIHCAIVQCSVHLPWCCRHGPGSPESLTACMTIDLLVVAGRRCDTKAKFDLTRSMSTCTASSPPIPALVLSPPPPPSRRHVQCSHPQLVFPVSRRCRCRPSPPVPSRPVPIRMVFVPNILPTLARSSIDSPSVGSRGGVPSLAALGAHMAGGTYQLIGENRYRPQCRDGIDL